jgi:riboflavin synthase
MSHQITIEADYNNIILTQTDEETGRIIQEYFIHEDELNEVIRLLQLAQRKETHA